MKRGLKISLILGIIVFCLLVTALLLLLPGKFLNGYYLSYKVNEDKTTCTVTKCIPLGAKEIKVPKKLGRYEVSGIGAYAFANRAKLTAVSLPNSISEIGMGAFYECSGLTAVTLPESITSIDSYAFYNCKGLTSIALCENLVDIGARVFEGCTGVTEATVPTSAIQALPAESITTVTVNGGTGIADFAFRDFKNLKSITISPNVTTVSTRAFIGCGSITSATAPAEVISVIPKGRLMRVVINGGTQIAAKAFAHCNALASITLPPSLEGIGNMAFEGCYHLVEICNLSDLKITPGSLDNGGIGRYAMSVVTSTEEKSKVWADENGYLFYEDGDVCLLLGCMEERAELTLPQSCHGKSYAIWEYAFYIHTNITAITIPEGVVEIGAYAFAHCRSLKSVTFPESLAHIGKHAFYECENLEEVSLGKNLVSIGAFAFDECYDLVRVSFRGTRKAWEQVAQGDFWITYTSATEILCTDGKIALQ